MKRISVAVDESTLAKLRALARQRGVSFAAIARQALDEQAAEYQPKPTCLGIFDSGRSDISQLANERVPPRSWR